MVKKFNDRNSQLEPESAVVLTNEAKLSLYKKSQKSGISTDILEEVYRRGYRTWSEVFSGTPEQFAFDRVNSFIAGGFAVELDEDLKKACWKGYEAIGMKKKNGKTVPNCVPVKEQLDRPLPSVPDIAKKFDKTVDVIKKAVKSGSKVEKEHTKEQKTAEKIATAHVNERPDYYKKLDKAGLEEDAEQHSKNPDEPASRFIGSDELVTIYKSQTPGQVIKKVVREAAIQAAAAPAPTAATNAPTRLGRTAPTYQASTIGNQGLNRPAPNTYRASSPTSPRGMRSMTSGSTSATAKTLTPQRVSASQPTARTAPPPAPKTTASFGSTTKPTSVGGSTSFSQGGSQVAKKMASSSPSNMIQKMTDAGRRLGAASSAAAAPVGKGLSTIGKVLGPAGAIAGLVADAKPLNKGEDELGRQKSLGITKPNVTPGMGSTKNIEPVKGGSITTKAPDYYKGNVGDYTVKTGDTLSGIAARTGQSVADLASKNKFDSENKIAAGSKLFTGDVPTPPKREESESGKIKKIKEAIVEATYKGKTVPLNKPMKGDVKKSKVFVDPDGDGKAKKVNFGDKKLSIKKHIPDRKKSYCARSSGQGNLTDKSSANYWSRRAWNCEETEE